MSKTTINEYDNVLDAQTLKLLSESPSLVDVKPKKMQHLRDHVMKRIDDDMTQASRSFLTVHNEDGDWIEISPKIKKKVLFENPETGTEAYLLRAEPGAEAPSHIHAQDEHCMVLEGELSFDDIHLEAGDYHFAPAGSQHNTAYTDVGALVYIQTGQQFAPAML